MIFINCITEEIVQVNDKTRIDISNSFVSGDAITDIEIQPEVGADFISVFNIDQTRWYLDWAYSTSGEKTITVRATDDTATVSQTFTLNIISIEDDNLYSSDAQVFAIESELKRYIPEGKSSYNYLHREAQSRILNYLDRKRIWNSDGSSLTKDQVNINGEVQKWSLYETLFMIYTDLFISVGDKFSEKVNQYKALRNIERDRGSLRIDKDKSGTFEPNEEIQELKSMRLIRRW